MNVNKLLYCVVSRSISVHSMVQKTRRQRRDDLSRRVHFNTAPCHQAHLSTARIRSVGDESPVRAVHCNWNVKAKIINRACSCILSLVKGHKQVTTIRQSGAYLVEWCIIRNAKTDDLFVVATRCWHCILTGDCRSTPAAPVPAGCTIRPNRQLYIHYTI